MASLPEGQGGLVCAAHLSWASDLHTAWAAFRYEAPPTQLSYLSPTLHGLDHHDHGE